LYQQLLGKIAQILAKVPVPYMVIGGQAVLVYGEPRMTRDIDITLDADIDIIENILQAIQGTSFRPLPEDVRAFAKSTRVLPIQDDQTKIRVDLIFSFSPYEHVAIQRSRPLDINGILVNFASPEDLVIHKLVAGRPRDIEDAKSIVLRQTQLDAEYVEKWLKEFEPVVGRGLILDFRSLQAH
jgi:hypothetical protein